MLVDVGSAVKSCRSLGFSDDKIIIDTIMPSYRDIHLDKMNGKEKTNQLIFRTAKIYLYQMFLRDILHSIQDFPNVKWRYMISPEGTSVKHDSFDWNIFGYKNENMRKYVEEGIKDG